MIARRIAALGQSLQRRAGRIAEAERTAYLVEGLPSRVVDGGAKAAARADAGDVEKLAMAAADQQQQEGIGNRLAETDRDGMSFQMVDRDQRQPQRQRHGLAERQPDHHPADQARPGGGGDAVEIGEIDVGRGEGAAGDRLDRLDVGPRRDLRNHAAVGRMLLDLAAHDARQHRDRTIGRQAHDGGGGFVAAGF